MTPGPDFEATLQIAPGNGRLMRRSGACLFVPPPCDAPASELIDHLLESTGDLVEAVSDFIVANDNTPPFVLVTWPTGHTGDGIQLILRGDAAVTTDMASVPSLSGAGSPTWVEHRVRRSPDNAVIRSGESSGTDTSLTAGVVPAGGFSLHLVLPTESTNTEAEPPPAPATATATPAPASAPPTTRPPTNVAPEPVAAAPTPTPTPTPAPAPSGPENPVATSAQPASVGLAALRAATGRAEPDAEPLPTPVAPGADEPPPSANDQPDQPDQPDTALAAATAAQHRAAPAFPADPSSVAAEPSGGDDSPSRPPSFPGALSDEDDPEVTLGPDDLELAEPAPAVQRLVQATLCAAGHPNPPHQARCRVCDLELADDHTVTVEQPILAVAELPDGATVPIDGNIVLGRNPSATAARLDDDHRLVAFEAPGTVSRTHAVLSSAGWGITVTDCGSQGGSALVPADTDEPIVLTPWVPHELNGGDVVYLGGPTPVRILDVPG